MKGILVVNGLFHPLPSISLSIFNEIFPCKQRWQIEKLLHCLEDGKVKIRNEGQCEFIETNFFLALWQICNYIHYSFRIFLSHLSTENKLSLKIAVFWPQSWSDYNILYFIPNLNLSKKDKFEFFRINDSRPVFQNFRNPSVRGFRILNNLRVLRSKDSQTKKNINQHAILLLGPINYVKHLQH